MTLICQRDIGGYNIFGADILRQMKSPKVWSFELPRTNESWSLRKVAGCWVYLTLVGKGLM